MLAVISAQTALSLLYEAIYAAADSRNQPAGSAVAAAAAAAAADTRAHSPAATSCCHGDSRRRRPVSRVDPAAADGVTCNSGARGSGGTGHGTRGTGGRRRGTGRRMTATTVMATMFTWLPAAAANPLPSKGAI